MTTTVLPGCDEQPGTAEPTSLGPLGQLRTEVALACGGYRTALTTPGTTPRVVEAYLSEALMAVAGQVQAAEQVRNQLIRDAALNTGMGPRQLARLSGLPVSTAARMLRDLRGTP